MKFYIKEAFPGLAVSLHKDGYDVNICVNNSIVAWFDASKGALVYNEMNLRKVGLTVEKTHD